MPRDLLAASKSLASQGNSPINKNDNGERCSNRVSSRKQKTSLKSDAFLLVAMRLNLKIVLLLLTVAVVVVTFAVYKACSDFTFSDELVKRWDRRSNGFQSFGGTNDAVPYESAAGRPLQDIQCSINQEYTVHCKRDDAANEVYVPFSFLHSYFDVNGAMVAPTVPGGTRKFNWTHTNAKVNVPRGKYDPRGLFMYFENYNVEVRDRVKCISGAEGVPLSTQWEKRGYFYPTQIAQFALSHYSKNLTEPAPRIWLLEDADAHQKNWTTPSSSNISRIWHQKFKTAVVQFTTASGYNSAITLAIDQTLDLVLTIDLLLVTNSSSLMIVVENRETAHSYRLHYIPADLLLSVQQDNIYYGLGTAAVNKWRHLTRDLLIDVQKGIASSIGGGVADKRSAMAAAPKLRRSELRVVSLSLLGVGFCDNITLRTYDHMAHFYDAAEWFVQHQDMQTGGWPNPVRRSLNGFTELSAGWLSSMGQGHGISVLARAYWHSGGDERYLKAAARALRPYRVLSKDGGVLAQFLDKYSWYEEYPTAPASFVLNGFIYSLLGLYDLNATAPASIARDAGELYSRGMHSLKKMLLLYDTGSGTSYDLRHLSLGVAPNLARWDYHATHVNQLLLLATIDRDPLIAQTAERWRGYMLGKRAKHN